MLAYILTNNFSSHLDLNSFLFFHLVVGYMKRKVSLKIHLSVITTQTLKKNLGFNATLELLLSFAKGKAKINVYRHHLQVEISNIEKSICSSLYVEHYL